MGLVSLLINLILRQPLGFAPHLVLVLRWCAPLVAIHPDQSSWIRWGVMSWMSRAWKADDKSTEGGVERMGEWQRENGGVTSRPFARMMWRDLSARMRWRGLATRMRLRLEHFCDRVTCGLVTGMTYDIRIAFPLGRELRRAWSCSCNWWYGALDAWQAIARNLAFEIDENPPNPSGRLRRKTEGLFDKLSMKTLVKNLLTQWESWGGKPKDATTKLSNEKLSMKSCWWKTSQHGGKAGEENRRLLTNYGWQTRDQLIKPS